MGFRPVPAVVAWVVAVAGVGLLAAVFLWMRAPALRYPQLYRRGLVAGLAIVILEIAWIVTWVKLSR